MRAVAAVVLVLVNVAVVVSAASLRSSHSTKNKKDPSSDALAKVLDAVQGAASGNGSSDALAAAVSAAAAPKQSASAAAAPAQPKHRAKLDVGFAGFQANLTDELTKVVKSATTASVWTDALRKKLMANVTEGVALHVKEIMGPLKATIGKTWMAFPQDEQKDEFVAQLKHAFAPLLSGGLQQLDQHLQLAQKRVDSFANLHLPEDTLLSKSATTLLESIFQDHCYDSLAKKKKANATKAAPEKFCIQSAAGAIAHRLSDSENLLGETMRFEAGAMALVQKEARTRRSHGSKEPAAPATLAAPEPKGAGQPSGVAPVKR